MVGSANDSSSPLVVASLRMSSLWVTVVNVGYRWLSPVADARHKSSQLAPWSAVLTTLGRRWSLQVIVQMLLVAAGCHYLKLITASVARPDADHRCCRWFQVLPMAADACCGLSNWSLLGGC